MYIQNLLSELEQTQNAGIRYQVPRWLPFRDRVTFYRDGKILFERFCYGESAGLIFTMWGSANAADDALEWDYESCADSKKTEAPKKLCACEDGALFFDDKLKTPWARDAVLAHDAQNGYPKKGFLGLFKRK